MKAGYVRTPPESGIDCGCVGEADDLMKLFEVLLEPTGTAVRQICDVNVVDEIQRSFATDPRVKKRFSAHVYEIFSDYALAAYIRHQVETFWPWSSKIQGIGAKAKSYEEVFRTVPDGGALRNDITTVRFALNETCWKGFSKTFEAETTDCATPWDMQLILKMKRAGVRVAKNGRVPLPIAGWGPSNVSGADRRLAWKRAIETSLRYPVERGYTQANIDTMRTSESIMDTMWQGLDEAFQKVNLDGLTLHEGFLKYAEQVREISRTPPSVSRQRRAPKPSPAIGSAVPRSEEVRAKKPEVLPLRPVVEEPRTKNKTRKTSGPSAMDPPTANETTPKPSRVDTDATIANMPSPLTFKPKDRSLKVFRTMFHTNANDQQQGPIQFKDFLNAMIKVGFGAELLYGSVWHFTPGDSLSFGRSFQVHEPHPSSEISYRMARQLGRRLGRMYGWSGEDIC